MKLRTSIGLFLASLIWVVEVAAVNLVSGPEITATSTNAVIRWTTDTESGSRVQFGVSRGRLEHRAQGDVGTEHRVELQRLQAATTYYFTVGTARLPLATNSFSTLAIGGTRNQSNSVPTSPPPGPVAIPKEPPAQPRPPPAEVTWANVRSLPDHFDRHGQDFSARNANDYAAQAWLFLVRAKAVGLPAKRDADGVVRVFDPKTGAFAAYNRDGTTKTYFKPGRRGYFDDQPGQPVDLSKLDDFQPPR